MSLSVYNKSWLAGDYVSDRSQIVKAFENGALFNGQVTVPRPHSDGVVSMAIGYGYDLLRQDASQINTDLAAIGLSALSQGDIAIIAAAQPKSKRLDEINHSQSLSVALIQEKRQLLAELSSLAHQMSLSLLDEQHASDLLTVSMSRFEARFNADVAARYNLVLPQSRERAVLVSMAYNTGSGSTIFHAKNSEGAIIGPSSMVSALINDDRARAWYEIRYNSAFPKERGLVRRRFAEAHLFGLYSNPDNVSEQDALGAYRMFSDSGIRENIASYERKWGADIYASNTQAHYYVIGSATIDRELRAAADIIIEKYILASEGPAGIGVLDIYVGDDVDYYVRGEIKYSKNDLLIGNERNNLFIGGKGNDFLQGGAGNDIYVFESGWGTDVIDDAVGAGKILIDGAVLSAGNKQSESVWLSVDKAYRYVLVNNGDSNDLLVTKIASNDSLLIRNWSAGQFGIQLTDDAADSDVPTITGDTLSGNPDWYVNTAPVHVSVGDYLAWWMWDSYSPYDGTSPDDDFLFTGLGRFTAPAIERLIGGAGKDTLIGDASANFLDGGVDDDQLFGGAGADVLKGGDGKDILLGGVDYHDFTVARGGAYEDGTLIVFPSIHIPKIFTDGFYFGFDTLHIQDAVTEQVQSDGNDVIDVIDGGAGDDFIDGGAGDDQLKGGADNDVVLGGAGKDFIEGGEGGDRLYGDSTQPYVAGESGDDVLIGGDGNNMLFGQGGNDTLVAGKENDLLLGDYFDTSITPTSDHGDDVLNGGAGNDVLIGGGGEDILLGGVGDDKLYGDSTRINAALLTGLQSVNAHFFDHQATTPDASHDGNDMLFGGAGNDTLYGGGGADTLSGDAGDDDLYGGAGNDTYLVDGVGNDRIIDSDRKNNIIFENGFAMPAPPAPGTSNIPSPLSEVSESYTDENGNAQTKKFLLIPFAGSGTTLKVLGGYSARANFQLADGVTMDAVQLIAASGTELDTPYIDDESQRLLGTGGDDTLAALSSGYEVLGGKGDDTLALVGGNNTVYYNAGDGTDYLTMDRATVDPDAPNVLKFGNGISATDLKLGLGSLAIQVGSNPHDVIHIENFDPGNVYAHQAFDQFEFADGSVLSYAELLQQGFDISGSDDSNYLTGTNVDDRISALKGSDWIDAGEGNNTVDGGEGDDLIFSGSGQDELAGGDGNDDLHGGAGDDIYAGGAGDDSITDESGNDAYYYQLGDGHDVIVESESFGADGSVASIDTLYLGEGISLSHLVVERNYHDVRLMITDAEGLNVGSITLAGFLNSSANQIETVVFADGTQLVAADLLAQSVFVEPAGEYIEGSDDNDVIAASEGADVIVAQFGDDIVHGDRGDDVIIGGHADDSVLPVIFMGGDGSPLVMITATDNDALYGDAGNDRLEGGYRPDHDVLIGGSGDDTYTLHAGSGDDTIIESGDIGNNDTIVVQNATPEQIHVSRDATDLIIEARITASSLGNTLERVRVANFFVDSSAQIERVIIEDATNPDTPLASWDVAALEVMAAQATPWDDYLIAPESGGVLAGLAGNDTLVGSMGSDTYAVGFGDGIDTINEAINTSGYDVLQFDAAVDPDTVRVFRVGDDIVMTTGNLDNRVTLQGWFSQPDARIEAVVFANGTSWNSTDLEQRIIAVPTEMDDFIVGDDQENIISALDGNDQVYGKSGNDELHGDAGNDLLYGDDGNDVMTGDAGDDILFGGAGNDQLMGGAGNNVLVGGAGDDTYVYAAGDGYSVIEDAAGFNTLVLDGVLPDDDVVFSLSANDGDLHITIAGSERLLVRNWQQTQGVSIQSIVFADGTQWNGWQISANILDAATLGSDNIQGTPRADVLDGLGGSDVISGGEGNDTYVFAPGYGEMHVQEYGYDGDNHDKLLFKDGIRFSDLSFSADKSDLIISVGNADDRVVIDSFFDFYDQNTSTGLSNTLEHMVFDDGSVVNFSSISYLFPVSEDASLHHVFGYAADDIIQGGTADDALYGGSGNDELYGGDGIDALYGGAGNDRLNAGTASAPLSRAKEKIYDGSGNNWGFVNTPDFRGYVFGEAETLYGGVGDDTYVINGDGGIVNIVDNSGIDTVLLGAGIDLGSLVANYNPANHDGQIRIEYQNAQGQPSAFYLNTDTSVTSIQSASGESVLISDLFRYVLTQQSGSSGNDVLVGESGPQILSGDAGDDVLAGGAGRDSLFGGLGNDILLGGAGNDILIDDVHSNIFFGGSGNDILTGHGEIFGGSGNDTLSGYGLLDAGTGNDTLSISDLSGWQGVPVNSVIVFDRGYGQDVMVGGKNSIIFLKNLMPEDIDILGGALPDRDNHRMILQVKGSDDRLVGIDSITKIEFADGSVWNADDIARVALAPVGTSNDDSLRGSLGHDLINSLSGNDWIDGGAGNDVLLGGAGDDRLLGGAGDDFLDGDAGADAGTDYLEGGAGKDTYRLARNQGMDYLIEVADGSDTIIQVDADIAPADLFVTRTATDFRLWTVDPESGQVSIFTISDGLLRSGAAGQLYIRFSDGTEWNQEQLLDQAGSTDLVESNNYNTVNGLHGSPLDDLLIGTHRSEIVNGFAGDDVLDGGAGDDVLVGGEGHDTYIFGYGSGHDSIDMATNADFENDSIQLKAGVLESDVHVTLTAAGDLVITLAGNTDSITLNQWITSDTDHRIGTLRFDDGHSLSLTADPQGPFFLSEENNDFGVMNSSPYDDIVYGMGGNDRLYGGGGDDRLYGGGGDDVLLGGQGSNIMEGGAGKDVYVSAAGVHGTTDTIILGRNTGQDSLDFHGDINGLSPLSIEFQSDVASENIRIGLAQRPTCSLNSVSLMLSVSVDGGDTQLVGIPLQLDLTTDQVILPVTFVFADGTKWSGAEILQKALIQHAGGDSHLFVGDSSRDNELRGSNQDDVLLGLGENDSLLGGDGNDYLLGGGGSNQFSAGDGDDVIWGGSGEDILDGGHGDDTLSGGNGNNTYVFAKNFGMDTITLQQQEHATLQFNDGLTSRDALLQVFGNDIVISIAGNTGSQVRVQGALSITDVGGFGGEFVTCNMGAIVFADGVRWTPNQILTHLGFSTPLDDDIFLSNTESFANGGFGDDVLVGGDNNDLLYGDVGDDRIAGAAGTDLLVGGQGNDTYAFIAGDGADEIRDGGNAEDIYDILIFGKGIQPANVSRQVYGNDIILTVNGSDTITIRGGMSADLAVERILFADGTVLDSRTWQPLPAMTLAAGQGTVSLLRSQQLSHLAFDAGITPDQLQCTRDNNNLVIALANGNDRWVFKDWFNNISAPAVLSAQFANGEVWFSDDFTRQTSLFVGTDGDDHFIAPQRIASILSGAAGNDYLQGSAMADLLGGGAGDDVLDGGVGVDVMQGGTGDDIYFVDNSADIVFENSGEGRDLIVSGVDMILQENIEDLSLTGSNAINATGNEKDNILTGNALDNHLEGLLGNDTLDGGAGADYMAGGMGNDSYYVDNYVDAVDEGSDAGSDTVFSAISYVLSDNLENLTLLGDGRINGTGNQKDNLLTGNVDNNVLFGLEGNDVVNGGAGSDVMVGGLGNDHYYVDNGGDSIVENIDEGEDSIFSSVSYSLGSALENLTLIGAEALVAYGNDSNNALTGNNGANVLLGDAGDDRLDGGAGDDMLVGGSGNDTYVFRAQGGIDTISDATDINSGAGDTIEFAAGITPNDITLLWRQNDLVVSVRGMTDRMVVQNFRTDSNEFSLNFQNGTTWSREQILTLANNAAVDLPPQLMGAIGDVGLVPGTFFSALLPASTFIDPDQGDTLAWRLTLSDGSPLPSWLHFDQSTLQLSGTPESDDVGLLTLRASVMDAGGQTTATSFRLNIRSTDTPNHAPLLTASPENQAVTEGQRFEFLLPVHLFSDSDPGDVVTVSASLANGDALPAWLSFDAQSGAFSGMPAGNSSGTLDIQILGTDTSGDFSCVTFQLAVADRNLAPVASQQLPDILAVEDQALSITIPTELFTDPDGDSITYHLRGADGQALPAWLHYDADQNRLYGLPAKDQIGSTSVSIVAADGQGHYTEQKLNVVVQHVNHAPLVAYTPLPLEVTEDQALNLWPVDMIVDPDRGDLLTYTLNLVSSSARQGAVIGPVDRGDLLNSDRSEIASSAPVLSGNYSDLVNNFGTRTTNYWDIGRWTYLLTVTDRAGESVQQNITIDVKPSDRNHAPMFTADWMEGGNHSFTQPLIVAANREQGERITVDITNLTKSMFVDVDGDVLTYGVMAVDNASVVSNPVMDWDAHSLSFTVEDSAVRSFGFYLTATDSHGAVARYLETVLLDRAPEPISSSVFDTTINIQEDSSFSIQLPQNMFMDSDGDAFRIFLGVDLPYLFPPPFLNFNADSLTLSAVAGDFDVGSYNYLYIGAVDQYGLVGKIPLIINVVNTYDAPRSANLLGDILVYSDQSITVETGLAFSEVDLNQTLTYAVTLSNGGALPSWLSFNANTGLLQGSPALADIGNYSVHVSATDTVGGVASDDFVIGVYSSRFNHAPVLSQIIADRAYRAGNEFSFALPHGTFVDVDPDDALTYQVTLADASPLPSWLHFNATTQSFSGIIPSDQQGPVQITVKAFDRALASASGSFVLGVYAGNSAPYVINPVSALQSLEDSTFTWTLPANTFSDEDVDEILTYSITQQDGSPLPAWLHFDPATNTLQGTPQNADVGSLSLMASATDSQGAIAVTQFSLVVDDVNDAPTFVHAPQAPEAIQDQAYSYQLPPNVFEDIDAGDALSYVVTQADGSALPSWLTFDFLTRVLSGTPVNTDVGMLSLRIVATDTAGASVGTVFNIAVANVNDAPVVVDATMSLQEDTAELELLTGNLLSNARDVDQGDIVSAVAGIFHGQYGVFTLSEDGHWQYQPDTISLQSMAVGEQVLDSFTYQVSDGHVTTSGLLRFVIDGSNDTPLVTIDQNSMLEDQPHTSGNVLANDHDVDHGAQLTIVNSGDIQGSHGALHLDATGTYVYATDNDGLQALAAGETVTEHFDYVVTDGVLESASSLTITIAGENDAPVAQEDAALLLVSDGAVFGNVLSNDSDVDHATVLQTLAAVHTGQYGVLQMGADGGYHYVLNQNDPVLAALAEGESLSETFSYDVTDGALTSSATITLNIQGSNDAPVASVDAATMAEDQAIITGNVLGNDSDVDHGAHINVVAPGEFSGQYGVLSLTAEGGWSYVLNNSLASVQALAEGQLVSEVFAYQVTDGALSAFSALTITIAGRNDAPLVTGETVVLDENTASFLSGNVLSNDVDVDGGINGGVSGDALHTVATTVQGLHGVFVLQADGAWTYQPATAVLQSLGAGQSLEDVIAYSVNDGMASSSGDIRFVINGVNDAPITQDDAAALTVGTASITGNVLSNDSDVDQGTVLQVLAATVQGQYGTLNLLADGSYDYVLNSHSPELVALAEGVTLSENFSYTATDGMAPVAGSLRVTIAGVNDAPVLTADVVALSEDAVTEQGSVQGNVLSNDSDPDHGDTLSVVAGTLQGQFGVLNIDNAGHYNYQLNNGLVQSLAQGESLQDSFSYAVTDGALTATSNLAVNILGSNDAPVASADSASMAEDQISVAGNVLANDHDVDHAAILRVLAPGQRVGQYGVLTVQANGDWTYALNNNQASVQALAVGQTVSEVFAYQVTDGLLHADSALTVTIAGVNDAPGAQNDTATVTEDVLIVASGNVLSNDSDVDAATVLAVNHPGTLQGIYGQLMINADGSYRYELANNSSVVQSLAAGEFGAETFHYSAVDGQSNTALSSDAVLTVQVNGRNDAPVVAHALADQATELGQAFTVQIDAAAFTDIDHNDVLSYSVTRADGTALPNWLHFDAQTLILSGTAPGASDNYALRVSAIDKAGALASTGFTLAVVKDECCGLVITGTICNDVLIGSNCDDLIDGSCGADVMIGKAGNDTFIVDNEFGIGCYDDPANTCGPVLYCGDQVIEKANEGYDTVKSTVCYVLPQNVEALQLEGCLWISGTGNSLDNWINGNSGDNCLKGEDGNDHLLGGAGCDTLAGGAGTDLLQGGTGNDTLSDCQGNGLLDGGEGWDTLYGNAQSNLFIGGKGNDVITLGGGKDVVSFNRGDGRDVIADAGCAGGNLVLSLGGGITYADLKFHRLGADLILETGNSDAITLQGWYGLLPNRPVVTLQTVAESMPGFSQTNSNHMLDDKLETFNFNQMAARFDSQTWFNLGLTQWSLTNALAQFQLSGSDTAALGGNLAYQYGMTGSVAGIGAVSAQSELSAAAFGGQAQVLKPLSGLSDGVSKLG